MASASVIECPRPLASSRAACPTPRLAASMLRSRSACQAGGGPAPMIRRSMAALAARRWARSGWASSAARPARPSRTNARPRRSPRSRRSRRLSPGAPGPRRTRPRRAPGARRCSGRWRCSAGHRAAPRSPGSRRCGPAPRRACPAPGRPWRGRSAPSRSRPGRRAAATGPGSAPGSVSAASASPWSRAMSPRLPSAAAIASGRPACSHQLEALLEQRPGGDDGFPHSE